MKTLDIYLYNQCIGHLQQDISGHIKFSYSAHWLEQPNAKPLSLSLPLQAGVFNGKACRGFFTGILPEGHQRELIAKNLGISAHNDFAMLEKIGGECAGAVSFLPHHHAPPVAANKADYKPLTVDKLAELLQSLPRRPLGAGMDDVRLSLAGVQDKFAVAVLDNKIYLPLHDAPSSHIIKPAIAHFEETVWNEAFCLRLAKSLGIPVANVQIGKAEQVDYLLVERYDRTLNDQNSLVRLHQEDFCQALGISPNFKYQNEGGPSLKKCFDLVRRYSDLPVIDVRNLLDVVLFNYLIGNHDAHGKNFSILYFREEIRLAPFYDLLCTAVYPELTPKMAMKVGGEYKETEIKQRHWKKFAEECDFSANRVLDRLNELADEMLNRASKLAKEEFPQSEIIQKILGHLAYNVEREKRS